MIHDRQQRNRRPIRDRWHLHAVCYLRLCCHPTSPDAEPDSIALVQQTTDSFFDISFFGTNNENDDCVPE